MKSAPLVILAMVSVLGMVACSSSQNKTSKTAPLQVVEFKESEVPYIQVSKKNGKVSAEVVDPSGNQVTVKE
ncbi:MAG: hypothetical protein AAGB31_13510 [Bdellovibrio sp.]